MTTERIRMMMKHVLLISAITYAASAFAAGATLYVSKAGTDTPPFKTVESASRTITAACKAAAPGDTIVILDSEIYEESGMVVPAGRADARTTLKGAPGQRPTIFHSGGADRKTAISLQAYCTLENLIVTSFEGDWAGNNRSGVVAPAPHVKIANVIAHNFQWSGIDLGIGSSHTAEISDCLSFNCGNAMAFNGGGQGCPSKDEQTAVIFSGCVLDARNSSLYVGNAGYVKAQNMAFISHVPFLTTHMADLRLITFTMNGSRLPASLDWKAASGANESSRNVVGPAMQLVNRREKGVAVMLWGSPDVLAADFAAGAQFALQVVLLPEPIVGVAVSAPRGVRLGSALQIAVQVLGADGTPWPGLAPIEITITDPTGKAQTIHRAVPPEGLTCELPTEATIKPGKLRVAVRELVTANRLPAANSVRIAPASMTSTSGASRKISRSSRLDPRMVASAANGLLVCYDAKGTRIWERNLPAHAAIAFMGDTLAAADAHGIVRYFGARGKLVESVDLASIAERPDLKAEFARPEDSPVIKAAFPAWRNPPLTQGKPNLAIGASIEVKGQAGWYAAGTVQNEAAMLNNGKADDIDKPWYSINEAYWAAGWKYLPKITITFKEPKTVEAVLVKEHTQHPESVPHEIAIEAQQQDGSWITVATAMHIDRVVHAHTFKPVTTKAIRYTIVSDLLNNFWTTELEVY